MSYEVWGDGDDDNTDHLLDAGWWPGEQTAEVVDAIKALRAEPLYQNGRMVDGISTRFLMRITMLEVAAGIRPQDDPFAKEAMAHFA